MVYYFYSAYVLRSRGRWIDQIRNDNSQTPADLWRQAFGRDHRGQATRRPMLAMRWWWWYVLIVISVLRMFLIMMMMIY